MSDDPISKVQLGVLEKYLDKIWKAAGIDIEFTKHFFDRVNDPRNQKQITVRELQDIFVKTYRKYADKLKKMRFSDVDAVLTDLANDINIPFTLRYNKSAGELELVSKTVMRKKGFMSSDPKYVVEGTKEFSDLVRELNESPEIYQKLYALTDSLGEIKGVASAGSSDMDSSNIASINLELNPKSTTYPENMGKKVLEFELDSKQVLAEIKKVLSKHNASLIGKVYYPKKKYAKDRASGENMPYYDSSQVSFEVRVR